MPSLPEPLNNVTRNCDFPQSRCNAKPNISYEYPYAIARASSFWALLDCRVHIVLTGYSCETLYLTHGELAISLASQK